MTRDAEHLDLTESELDTIPSHLLDGCAAESFDGHLTGEHGDDFENVSQVGPYRLLKEIGRGGFGRVYLAENADADLPRHRTVAVKLLRGSGSAATSDNFRDESNALKALSHPGIVSLLDSGLAGPHLAYLAMDYVQGSSIDAYCDQPDCDWKAIVHLMIQACRAIEHAHARGVLHCDLKPANLLVDQSGEVIVTDFGLVRFFEESNPAASLLSKHLRGTPAYMAPEQLLPRDGAPGGEISIATDVFGLAATLYRLLSKQAPRAARSTLSAITLSTAEAPIAVLEPNLAKYRCPRALLAVTNRGLQLDPERRYATVGQLREDLENVLALRPVRAEKQTAWDRSLLWVRREPISAALVSVAMLACIASGFLLAGWWQAELSKRAILHDHLRAATNTVKDFQGAVMRLRPGEDLSSTARADLLAATRNQFAQFVSLYPNDRPMRYKYAQACYILAEYLNEVGEEPRAIDEIQLAIAEYGYLLGVGYEPETMRFDLFHAYHKLGYVEHEIGRTEPGNESLMLATDFISSLSRAHPQNLDYADCYAANGIAFVHLNADLLAPDTLREHCLEALAVAEALYANPASEPRHWKHRISAHKELARLAVREGRPELALQHYRQAVAYAREAFEAAPEAWNFRLDLLRAESELANCAIEQGRFAVGLEAIEASEAHLLWLQTHRPDLHLLPFIVTQRNEDRSRAAEALR